MFIPYNFFKFSFKMLYFYFAAAYLIRAVYQILLAWDAAQAARSYDSNMMFTHFKTSDIPFVMSNLYNSIASYGKNINM